MTDSTRDSGLTERRREPTAPSTTRRTFVKAAGAAGLVGGLSSGITGSAVAQTENTVPWIERESRNSNLIVDPQGNEVVLRGINIPDPYRCARDAPDYKLFPWTHVEKATDAGNGWHADVIRIPMQPNDIAGQGAGAVEPKAYTMDDLEWYLDSFVEPTVREAKRRGAYVILDYHRHLEAGPRWDNEELSEELHQFWDVVAPRYAGDPHVIYELFNEPTEPYAGYEVYNGGPDVTDDVSEQTWLDWKEQAQPWVDTVRSHADNLLIIGNPRWSQWTYWAANSEEFEGENLAYCGHFYTQDNLRPLSTYFGEPSEEVPVFITEFGFGGPDPHMSGGADPHADEYTQFFEEYDSAHWVGWCFDFDWEPSMLQQSDYSVANAWGEWNKSHLERWADADSPAGMGGDRDADDGGVAARDWWLTLNGKDSVRFNWNDVEGAASYRLYAEGELMIETDGNEGWIQNEFEERTMYEFTLAAVDDEGTEFSRDSTWVITKGEGDAGLGYWDDEGEEEPDAPTSPGDQWTNEVTSSSIELGWEAVSNADHYNVSRDGTQVAEPPSTTYTFTGLSPDTTYTIGLEAENDAGTSGVTETEIATEPDDTTTPDCEGAEGGSETVDGQTVCDVNDDGYYRDVTGDGSVGQGDVAEFFTKQHRSAWKQPDMFDFSGNDAVTHGDVVELFDYVALNG